MQVAAEKEIELHQLKFKPGLPKLSPRFVAFTEREGSSFSRNGSFTVWVETSCYSLLFWLWLKGEKKVFQTKFNDMGGALLWILVCLNSVLKAKLGGYESTWNEKVNVDLFWTN